MIPSSSSLKSICLGDADGDGKESSFVSATGGGKKIVLPVKDEDRVTIEGKVVMLEDRVTLVFLDPKFALGLLLLLPT